MTKSICIHGHFYQPPRENPWLEEVEQQDSAHPYHDWNERITDECYAPNTAARILDDQRRIIDLVNNYANISFDFGPTLLTWMERRRPDVYQAVLEADRISLERFNGHGAALAQVYNHMIMPLANKRDKYTQVYWGLRDFEHRFNRFPEGMWLPETAVDTPSLEVLAELGIRFTLLAPSQAQKVRKIGEPSWDETEYGGIDPKFPYLCHLPSGRQIVIYFYDGPISQDVAFGDLLQDGGALANRLLGAFDPEADPGQLVHIATDGETYGHHHRLGDMALAYCLYRIQQEGSAQVTVYGAHLESQPPEREVIPFEPSSWSCVHGVERWRSDCGCCSGLNPDWQQRWRKPLREGLDWLRDQITPAYVSQAQELSLDPWQARNAYLERLLNPGSEATAEFLGRQTARVLTTEQRVQALRLLELQRHAMFMFTSCGWFFDDISGLESTQILMYAGRVLQLAEEALGLSLEQGLLEYLEQAPSNVAAFGTGAEVFRQRVASARLDLLRVGAHYAISCLFEPEQGRDQVYCYLVSCQGLRRREAGSLKQVAGQARLVSQVTGQQAEFSFAALHLGEHNVVAGLRQGLAPSEFAAVLDGLEEAFARSDVPELVRQMDAHFPNRYTLWHLFKDSQQRVLNEIMQGTLEDLTVNFRQIVDANHSLINFLCTMSRPLPRPLAVAAEFVINQDLRLLLEQPEPDLQRLEEVVEQSRRWKVPVQGQELRYRASWSLGRLFESLGAKPGSRGLLEEIEGLIQLFDQLGLKVDLWKAQNVYFDLTQSQLKPMRRDQAQGDQEAGAWIQVFERVGELLGVCPE